jgi:hypothetical protein
MAKAVNVAVLRKRCKVFHNYKGVQQISEFMVSEKKIDPLVLVVLTAHHTPVSVHVPHSGVYVST